MSAICGIVESRIAVTEELLLRVRDAMVLRGPDEQGLYLSRDRRAGLGHRSRLTNGSAQTPQQPASNEDGTVWAVCDGEIYNSLDLRKSLDRSGHVFRSSSQAEVIVHLYEERGEAFPSELDGEFAIGLLDEKTARCYLVRDRIGKQPLYYAWDGTRLLFASEIRAIAGYPDMDTGIDPMGLDDYLSFGYVTCPRTIFRGIRKLPPAHILRCDSSEISSRTYWSPAPEPNARLREDNRHEASIYEQIQSSLRKSFPRGRTAGVLLSGGLFSSSIAGLLSLCGDGTIKTFSLGFAGEEDEDVLFAREVSNRFGTSHESILIDPQPACDLIPAMATMLDEPLATQEGLPSYLISTALQGRVGVCLSGEGGRELFGDPSRHRLALDRQRLLDSLKVGNEALEESLHDALSPPFRDYLAQLSTFTEEEKQRLVHTEWKVPAQGGEEDRWPAFRAEALAAGREDYLGGLQGLDVLTRLPDSLLATIDRSGTFGSIELRLPLLDPALIRTALGIPLHLKTSGGIDRYILRKAMARVLPQEVLWRAPRSSSFPLTGFFSSGLEDYAKEVLLGSDSNLFRRATLNALFRQDWLENPQGFSKVWTLVMFEEWRRACHP